MEFFQDDLFPDTKVTWEPALTSSEWFSGIDKAPKKMSLKPSDMTSCKYGSTGSWKSKKKKKKIMFIIQNVSE